MLSISRNQGVIGKMSVWGHFQSYEPCTDFTKIFKFLMNPNYMIGHCVARNTVCKFVKIFYFLKCYSDLGLGRFFALLFGDYNIHNNIKVLQYS